MVYDGLSCKLDMVEITSPLTLTGAGHPWTVSTKNGYIQWLLLDKSILKIPPPDDKNRALVVCTSKRGWAICELVFCKEKCSQ